MSINEEVSLGIVLKSTPYKESDCLLSVYTLNYGRITILAKGVRKLKSKNASSVQEMTLSEFTFIPRNGISTLIKASSIEFYRHIKEDLRGFVYGSYFLEYIYKATAENEPDEMIFQGIRTLLDKMNQGIFYPLIYAKLNVFMLEIQGMLIEVDECADCGNTSGIQSVSINKLGLICKDCMTSKDSIYSKEVLKLFRHIVKVPIEKIDNLQYDSVSLKQVNLIIDAFVEEYSGIYFQSKKFF